MSSSCCKPPDASTLPLLCLPVQTRRPGHGLMARQWPEPLLANTDAEHCLLNALKLNVSAGWPNMARIVREHSVTKLGGTLFSLGLQYFTGTLQRLFQLLHEQKQALMLEARHVQP